jgi:ELWxxDGT repeat protein
MTPTRLAAAALVAGAVLLASGLAAEVVPRPAAPHPLRPFASLGAVALAAPVRQPGGLATLGEIWRSDGTSEGTWLVRDLAGQGVGDAREFDGFVLFAAHTEEQGWELWRSDGTTAGTRLVRDIRHGPASSSPRALRAVGGALLFAADDGVHGRELWRSDGTASGTRLVAESWPGPTSGLPAEDDPWFGGGRLEGRVYFAASDPLHGRELWSSDGTAGGTRLVRDLASGAASGAPRQFVAVGGRLFFVAVRPNTGAEPWSTDGTLAGTRLVADVVPGARSSMPDLLGAAGSRLLIGADTGAGTQRALGWTEGSGVHRLATVQPRYQDPYGLAEHVSLGGRVVFAGFGDGAGLEPWVSDGTAAGTARLADLQPAGWSYPAQFARAGGLALFLASTDSNYRLWRTNGTPGGTICLRSFPWGGFDVLTPPIRAGDLWLVSLQRTGVHGRIDEVQLWRTDGTPSGTRPVRVAE